MARRAVLGVDIGTSSVRSALFNARGIRIAGTLAQRQYPLITDHDGRAELSPNGVLRALRACLDDTHASVESAKGKWSIEAVGTSCFWHSLVGLNERGKPLTAFITWADGRPGQSARTLRARADETAYHQLTGCMMHASFWPARLRWLRKNSPRLFSQVAQWVSPSEWLIGNLSGNRNCAHSMASATGLYDFRTRAWSDHALSLAGLRSSQLPAIGDAGQPAGRSVHKRWPLFGGAVWYPAIGDGAAGNLGSGATTDDTLALNYGTSAALRLVGKGVPKTVPKGLFTYRLDTSRFLLGGATSNGGIVRQWFENTLALPLKGERLSQWIAKQAPTAHKLTVLPFLNGERAPFWRDDLTASLSGLRNATSALDIACALTHASFQRLGLIADAMPGARRRTALVSGGLASSPASLRLMADVTGLQLKLSKETEASLRGAAVFALENLGEKPGAPKLGPLVTPDKDRAAAFRRERRRLTRLEQDLFD
ncbi:MAG: gluconokinase [Gammaproteobacteria bacterium]